MDILGLNQVPSQGGQVKNSEKQVMGKDDFLRLLVVQLQAQDPLNPMDARDFTAQLAQFSSLEQLQNVNSTLSGLVTSQTVMTNGQALGFIGKTVSALGNAVSIENGEGTVLEVDLARDTTGTFIGIYDSQGGFVRNLEVGALTAGRHSIAWDGQTSFGSQAADGSYFFEVNALDDSGNSVDTTSFTSGLIKGVNFKNGTAYLLTDQQEIPMGNVVKVLSVDEPQE